MVHRSQSEPGRKIKHCRISDYYHNEFTDCFNHLGFLDLYGKHPVVNIKALLSFHKTLRWWICLERSTLRHIVTNADNYPTALKGLCPHCGEFARGDQCESCGSTEPENLIQPECNICGVPLNSAY